MRKADRRGGQNASILPANPPQPQQAVAAEMGPNLLLGTSEEGESLDPVVGLFKKRVKRIILLSLLSSFVSLLAAYLFY